MAIMGTITTFDNVTTATDNDTHTHIKTVLENKSRVILVKCQFGMKISPLTNYDFQISMQQLNE